MKKVDFQFFYDPSSFSNSDCIDLPLLTQCAEDLLLHLKKEGSYSAELKICSKQEICQLHQEYFNDPDPTDVISFPSEEVPGLGDIALCFEVAKEEAEARGHSTQTELQFYALHGLLHLLGFEDSSEEERDIMLSLQRNTLIHRGIEIRS